ncbi:MAG: prenyltransferase/squalene oxidase repeat-containing protein [Bryobacteraceae bacterium]
MSTAQPATGAEDWLPGAAAQAASWLASMQSSEGLWPNLLEAGPHLDVLYALLTWFLDRKQHPFRPPHREAWAQRLLARQNTDGGFAASPQGRSRADATFEAYLALRLAGVDPRENRMRRAAEWLARKGGMEACGPVTLLKYCWAGAAGNRPVPAAAPEHYFFLDYGRSPALERQQDVCAAALAIAAYLRDGARQGETAMPTLESEFPPLTGQGAPPRSGSRAAGLITQWARIAPRALRDPIVFRTYDAMIGEALRWPTLPVALHAALAVRAAKGRGSHALDRFERVISLLGPAEPDGEPRPVDFGVRTTAIAALALAFWGARDGAIRTAAALKSRFRQPTGMSGAKGLGAGWPLGDLHTEPDVETTAWALLGLRSTGTLENDIMQKAVAGLVAVQRDDGGWSASGSDPSSPDITGTVVEALVACGQERGSPPVHRAVKFLEESQHAEAWWPAARGICRLYGTAMALRGLRAAGYDDREAPVLRAGEWIRSIQNADGGWGEDPESCPSGEFRAAASTPAQTAWALLGLLAGGDTDSESVRRGFAWLKANQRPEGGWNASAPTLPGVAYAPCLVDPLGATLWPLLALRERLDRASD